MENLQKSVFSCFCLEKNETYETHPNCFLYQNGADGGYNENGNNLKNIR